MRFISTSLPRIYAEHRDALVAALDRIVRCRDTAEDLVHDAYLKVHQVMGRETIDAPGPFLLTTARHLALDHLRARRVRDRLLAPADEGVDWEQLPTSQPSPEQAADALIGVEALERLLRQLPARQREILLLHRVVGLRYGEIASRLGVSTSTVEKDLRAALLHCIGADESPHR